MAISVAIIMAVFTTLSPMATGQEQPTVQAAATTKKAADPDKMICHHEMNTGSMMAKRICHTRAQWDEIDGINAQNRDRFGGQSNQPVRIAK